MRYQRVRSRYVALVSVGQGLAYGDLLRTTRFSVAVAPRGWRPPTDVCETPDSIEVTLELAGVEDDDVEIQLFEDAVVIEGQRMPVVCAPDGVYHNAEIRHGPFRVEVQLPAPVDADAVNATYDRGYLRISLPKRAPRRGRGRVRHGHVPKRGG